MGSRRLKWLILLSRKQAHTRPKSKLDQAREAILKLNCRTVNLTPLVNQRKLKNYPRVSDLATTILLIIKYEIDHLELALEKVLQDKNRNLFLLHRWDLGLTTLDLKWVTMVKASQSVRKEPLKTLIQPRDPVHTLLKVD
jgi:hypothetical protein